MTNASSNPLGRVSTLPTAKYAFVALILLLITLAVGHLYLLDGLTTLYFGLPLWVWFQLVIVFGMVGIAWLAIYLFTVARQGGT